MLVYLIGTVLVAWITGCVWEIKQMWHDPRAYFTYGLFVLMPYNAFLEFFSKVPNVIMTAPTADLFPNVHRLRAALPGLMSELKTAAASGTTVEHDRFFKNITPTPELWKQVHFKWYGPFLKDALVSCPRTCALLETMPEVHLAMVSILEPGASIHPHNGYMKGYLRYHMGLDTPADNACYINVLGRFHSWRDSDDIMFDDTYVHWVENKTSQQRIILFLDVERPLSNRFATFFNRMFLRHIPALIPH